MVIKTWKVKEEVKEEKIKGDNIQGVRNERNKSRLDEWDASDIFEIFYLRAETVDIIIKNKVARVMG